MLSGNTCYVIISSESLGFFLYILYCGLCFCLLSSDTFRLICFGLLNGSLLLLLDSLLFHVRHVQFKDYFDFGRGLKQSSFARGRLIQ